MSNYSGYIESCRARLNFGVTGQVSFNSTRFTGREERLKGRLALNFDLNIENTKKNYISRFVDSTMKPSSTKAT